MTMPSRTQLLGLLIMLAALVALALVRACPRRASDAAVLAYACRRRPRRWHPLNDR